jgi:tetratricopeptide (TPR) repeat protein
MPVGESQRAEPGCGVPDPTRTRDTAGRAETTVAVRLRGRNPLWIAGVVGTLLGVAAVVIRSPHAGDPDRLFREARAALDARQPAKAAEAVEALLRLREPTPFDRLLRAQVDEALRRPDEALGELARIEAPHPLAPLARVLAGQIEVKRYRLRSAEALFLAALALEPKAVQAHRELTYLYNIQHRQDDLDRELSALSELNSLTLDQLVHWGKTRNVVWKPDRDCEELAKFVAADPSDRRSRLALADGLRRLNRWDEALAALEPLPASDPDAIAARALIALDRGDNEALDRLLADGPRDHPVLARLRGHRAILRGDFPSAVAHYRRAYDADPTDRPTLQGLANALKLSGDAKAAEPYFEAARRHDAITPLISRASSKAGAEDPELPARLGAACEAAGRPFEARAWHRLALERDPLDRSLQQAVYRLGRAIEARTGGAQRAEAR